MITMQALKDFGADTESGLSRCLEREEFYLKMVNMAISNPKFDELGDAIEADNLESAFELCHALKGITGNVGLDPLYKKLCDMTELLRHKENADYRFLYADIKELHTKLLKM